MPSVGAVVDQDLFQYPAHEGVRGMHLVHHEKAARECGGA